MWRLPRARVLGAPRLLLTPLPVPLRVGRPPAFRTHKTVGAELWEFGVCTGLLEEP
jgi:hypothetical protein